MRLSLLFICLLLSFSLSAQTPMTFQYVYDEIGQLHKVIDSTGTQLEYIYDEVGNILEIKRTTVTGLAIFDFNPKKGVTDTLVTIQGQGFSTDPLDNTVSFNGVLAPVISADQRQLKVSVPATASTGLINIAVANQSTNSAEDFVIPAQQIMITQITPHAVAQNSTLNNFQVDGQDLQGASFHFVPQLNPAAIGIRSVNIATNGLSATMQLEIQPNILGRYVLIAETVDNATSPIPSLANTLLVVDPSKDDDGDGLSNLDELNAGTDPAEVDTDGDGITDNDEILINTDPLTLTQLPKQSKSLPLSYLNAFVLDTDNDGFSDLDEQAVGTDPNDANSHPSRQSNSLPVSYHNDL